jgi:hypothetical protein
MVGLAGCLLSLSAGAVFALGAFCRLQATASHLRLLRCPASRYAAAAGESRAAVVWPGADGIGLASWRQAGHREHRIYSWCVFVEVKKHLAGGDAAGEVEQRSGIRPTRPLALACR